MAVVIGSGSLVKGDDLIYATPYTFFTMAGEAGGSTLGYRDGVGSAARFGNLTGVAVDGAGNVYVADDGPGAIRKMTPAGVVTTLAKLVGPPWRLTGVAVDTGGNVYVADAWNHMIFKVTAAGMVTTLAGSAGSKGSADGTGSAAQFDHPCGVAVDGAGNVYVADGENHTIRKVTANGTVTTLAGLAGSSGSTDGAGSAARFNSPTGVAVDKQGNVYVADYLNNTIRKITAAGVVTTLAGQTVSTGNVVDAIGRKARLGGPMGLTVDRDRNVYVADYNSSTIRRVAPDGMVTTLAGSPAGFEAVWDGTGRTALFNNPWGVAVDTKGNVYVTGTNTIRKGVPPPPGLAEEAKEWGQKVAVIIVVGLLAVIWSDRRKAKAGGGGAR